MNDQQTEEALFAASEMPKYGAYHDTEYGVIEDRRSRGLGFCLLGTRRSAEAAQWLLDERQSVRDRNLTYPLAIKERTVIVSDWRDLSTPPGQTGGE